MKMPSSLVRGADGELGGVKLVSQSFVLAPQTQALLSTNFHNNQFTCKAVVCMQTIGSCAAGLLNVRLSGGCPYTASLRLPGSLTAGPGAPAGADFMKPYVCSNLQMGLR